MPVQFTLPPDTRATGTGSPAADMNGVVDTVTAMGAGLNVLNAAFSGGADPTGAADSAAAIQAALTAARTAGGGVVYLPPGTYLISQSLQIGSGTALAGAGLGATTIKAQNGFAATQVGSNGGMVMLATYNDGAVAQTGITVSGLTLDMNEANITTIPSYSTSSLRSSPMSLKNVTNLTISRVQVVNAIGYSVYPQGCTNLRVSGCVISSGQTAVTTNLGTNTSQDCIHVEDCTGVVIDGNIVQSGTHGGDDPIAILGVVTGCTDVTITGNTVLASGTHGITLNLGGASVSNVTISGNTVRNTQQEGLLLAYYTYAAGTLISNVTITGNAFTSIGLAGGRAITLNDATNATPSHIGTAGWQDVAIIGNTFSGLTSTSASGLYVQTGKNLQIMANTFDAWDCQHGFQIGDNISSTSLTVTGFQVIGNMVDMSSSTATSPAGLLVIDSVDGVVSGNTCAGPGTGVASGKGISLIGVTTNVTGCAFTSNRVKGWASGIADNFGADYNVYTGNNCHGNTAFISNNGTHDVVASNVVA